jgi:hypothetical protein
VVPCRLLTLRLRWPKAVRRWATPGADIVVL